eukprot:6106112-Prymnesium_polylepis.2
MPCAKLPLSIAPPMMAPPTDMRRNSGTTLGTRPCGRVAATSSSIVTPGSAVTVAFSSEMSRIWRSSERSGRPLVAGAPLGTRLLPRLYALRAGV